MQHAECPGTVEIAGAGLQGPLQRPQHQPIQLQGRLLRFEMPETIAHLMRHGLAIPRQRAFGILQAVTLSHGIPGGNDPCNPIASMEHVQA